MLGSDELFAQTVRIEQNVDAQISSQSAERREHFLEAISGFIVDALLLKRNQKPCACNEESEMCLKRFLKDDYAVLTVTTDHIQIHVRKKVPSGFEIFRANYISFTLH